MANSNATVVILNHGINDARDVKKVQVADYGNCLKKLAQTAKDAGKFIIFETPNPVTNTALESYVVEMRRVASDQGLSLIDQYAKWEAELEAMGPDRAASIHAEQSPDGTHPSPEFYKKKGEFAAQEYLKLSL